MSPRTLAICSTLEELTRAFSMEGSGEPWIFAANHSSVFERLHDMGRACIHLAQYNEDSEHVRLYGEAEKVVDGLLHAFDEACADRVCELIGVPGQSIFSPLFKYQCRYEYAGQNKTLYSLKKAVEQTGAERAVLFYSGHFSPILEGALPQYASEVLAPAVGIPVEVVDLGADSPEGMPESFVRSCLGSVVRRGRALRQKYLTVRLKKAVKKMLLLAPLYDLDFLADAKLPVETLHWEQLEKTAVAIDEPTAALVEDCLSQLEFDANTYSPVELSLARDIKRLFLSDFREDLGKLAHLDRIAGQVGIDAILWGNSPIVRAKSLLVEYGLRRGIPVIGMQHGGSYCYQDCGVAHFDSDFSRCTHYLSYGFEDADLARTYPGREFHCRIIPVGSTRIKGKRPGEEAEGGRTVSIVFPLTNSNFASGNNRINALRQTLDQIAILDFMENGTDVPCHVKPMPNYTDKNTGVCDTLHKMKRAELSRVPFSSFLEENKASMVIIEYPSSPLIEALPYNVDIFCLIDPVNPFSREALDLLRKRVHVFDDVRALLENVRMCIRNELEPLRDDSFFNKYVHRPDPRGRIVKALQEIVAWN